VLPTATVFAAGENELLTTEIPPVGGVVLPVGWFAGPVEPEPPAPPHAQSEAAANAMRTPFMLNASWRIWFLEEATAALAQQQAFCLVCPADDSKSSASGCACGVA